MAAAAMRISDRGCSSPSPPPPWLNFSSSSNKKCAHVPRNGSPQLTFDGAREGQMYDDVFFPIAAPFRVPTHAINIVDGGWHHGGPGSMQWSRHHCCRRRALSSPPPPGGTRTCTDRGIPTCSLRGGGGEEKTFLVVSTSLATL